MHTFIPVIHENNDGTSIFRHDIVNVRFPFNGHLTTLTFEFEDTAAPVLPLLITDFAHVSGFPVMFALDSNGGGWVEDVQTKHMMPYAAQALAIYLTENDHEKAAEVISVLKEREQEFAQAAEAD